MSTLTALCGWLFVILIVCGNGGKFKSCSTSGFCQRQKASNLQHYYVDSESVKMKDDAFESLLLYRPNPNDDSLEWNMYTVNNIKNNSNVMCKQPKN